MRAFRCAQTITPDWIDLVGRQGCDSALYLRTERTQRREHENGNPK